MADDNRWSERDRDWRDDRGWQEGREGGDPERWRRMHHDRRHEGPAGYNDSGPAQGGWSFGDPEQGGERGQGYGRRGYGREPAAGSSYGETWGARDYGRGGDQRARQGAFGQADYAYGPYTPYGTRGRSDYDQRGRGGYGAEPGREHETRSWLDRAGERVASFLGAAGEAGDHRGRGPRGYKRSDERIREDVNDRLTDDPWLDASAIEVQVAAAEVTLAGAIHSREDKRRAEAIAESVSGVTHVQNNLRMEQRRDEDAADLRDVTGPRQ